MNDFDNNSNTLQAKPKDDGDSTQSSSAAGTPAPKTNSKQALIELQNSVETILATLGYELVALEHGTAGGRKFTVFIDFLNNPDSKKRISLDDCIAANRALDDLFETTTLIDGAFTLEVSSPGVERPLRKTEDYNRFKGRKAKINTFRPLEAAEIENAAYLEKNKRQKNFIGDLEGLNAGRDKVLMLINKHSVAIPLELISKANLEYTEVVLEKE